jgi:galactokinase
MEAASLLGVPLLVEASLPMLEGAGGKLPVAAEKRARHILEEIARVEKTVLALRAGDLSAVGKLLLASHRSSQRLFENSTPELDFLVERLISTKHVHGARLTGGGFGGAVMALTSPEFGGIQAEEVASEYERRFGSRPDVLHTQTADGAELINVT